MKHRNCLSLFAAAIVAMAGISCRQNSVTTSSTRTETNPGRQTFQVKGVVKEVMADKKKVKITHEEIPNYMEAMTMTFDVKEARELAGLEPGDSVSFRMVVTENDGWIEQLKKLDEPRTPVAPAPTNFRRVRNVDPLVVGDLMPDYSFTNSFGRGVRLSDFKGQALAMTFIFTRCPFPTFCPRLSSNFSETQNRLKALPNGPTNWHLFSITIDPEYDTPQRLAAYAEVYKADPKHWDFVTADLTDITAIGEQFGLQFWRTNPSEPINHNVRTVVVDASGRVQWVTPDNEWKPETLVEQIVKATAARPQG